RLFRRLFLEALTAAHEAGELQFFAGLASLNGSQAFTAHLGPPRKVNWVVYAKRPFAGPKQVLAYLARYTHPLPGSGLHRKPRKGRCHREQSPDIL
ncbi:MAG: hypothetical protein HN608_05665, partial [Rhodospirillaceae bacterium]|nr:hypothetical protein [Rhodospirillaceae bacterium]